MTPADYLNPEKFPLTSQPQSSLRGQVGADGMGLNVLRQHRPEELTDEDRAVMKELEEKDKFREQMWEVIRAEQKAQDSEAETKVLFRKPQAEAETLS